MKNNVFKIVYVLIFILFVPLFVSSSEIPEIRAETAVIFPHQSSTLWSPYLEWSLTNSSFSGNPFDLIAT
ncbi:MAG: hypothetical protein DWQ04_28170, partial [Chloroflexi bacterium]